eukprot:TRINITY_DN398_c4_g1_i1.p1 TRINITY_DN398_c4_g1~~TRINITY_DN398_c4_g1_i1.p1  ORF type:complete len:358 (-),score=49.52 TRINITY_DN398_c4_g1_i1:410-1483(-)
MLRFESNSESKLKSNNVAVETDISSTHHSNGEKTKNDVVQSFKSFEDMGLNPLILRGIYASGFEKPSAIQSKAIVPTSSGRDIIAQAQSGTGKTLTFSVGVLQQIDFDNPHCQALILAPTRELAGQIVETVNMVGDYCGIRAHACIGGRKVSQDIQAVSGAHVVTGTVGRVLQLLSEKHLDPSHIKTFVLDEADVMLDDGFKDQIHQIFGYLPSSVQACVFSATLSPEVMHITNNFMNDPLHILVKQEEISLEGIRQFYINVENDRNKLSTLFDIYENLNVGQTVVFCNTRNMVARLTKDLVAQDYSVSMLHAELDQHERTTTLQRFKEGTTRILVASDLVERGIDVHRVSTVIQYY